MTEQDFVAEVMGVWASGSRGKWVELRHTTAGVQVSVGADEATLTPRQARRLAELLQRQADRYEEAAKLAAPAAPPPPEAPAVRKPRSAAEIVLGAEQ